MAKFQVVADRILKEVLTGRLGPGGRVPSEKDLAGDYAVSVQTVNKAISVLVSAGVLVRRGAQGAYVADALDIEGLRATAKLTVGIVYDASVQTITDSDRVLGKLTFHLQQLLSRHSFAWTLISRTDGGDFHDYLDSLDAVVTIGDIEPGLITERARPLPCVTFNRDFRALGPAAVLISTAAIVEMVDRLYAAGHRRFLFVANDAPRQVYGIRKAVFAQAVTRHGLASAELLIPETEMKNERLGPAGAAAVLSADAAFLPNDQLAIAFVRLLEPLGVRVPDDLSVCGHDNTLAGEHCSVPLTTIAYDIAEAAAAIVRTLGDVLYRRQECPLVTVDARLVVRASTAASRAPRGFAESEGEP